MSLVWIAWSNRRKDFFWDSKMPLGQFSYWLTAALGGAFFLFAKRRFDFFSTAYVAAVVYFLPGLFGYVLTPPTLIMPIQERVTLIEEAYGVMIVVILTILLGAICFDVLFSRSSIHLKLHGSERTVLYLAAVAVLGFALSVITMPETLLMANKLLMMQGINRWHLVWTVGASLGAVVSFTLRRWGILLLCCALLACDAFVGFRSSIATTLVALFTLWLASKGSQRLAVSGFKPMIAAGFCAMAVFLYKYLYISVKLGDWTEVGRRFTSPDMYLMAILRSEPFTTQMILHEVIRTNFQVGMAHFGDLIYQMGFFLPSLGGPPKSFNDYYQSALFPEAYGGMASNIWAEMLSGGGWPILLCFCAAFAALLAVGSALLRIRDASLRGAFALVFAYWAFYIHRNDLMYQINLEKRILVTFAACILLSMAVSIVSQGFAKKIHGVGD